MKWGNTLMLTPIERTTFNRPVLTNISASECEGSAKHLAANCWGTLQLHNALVLLDPYGHIKLSHNYVG